MTDIPISGTLQIGPYKGYQGVAEFDPEERAFHGKVSNTRDVITFTGGTLADLQTAFAESIEDYLEFCRSLKQEPEKPYSGRFLVRTTPSLHRDLARCAEFVGKSLNQYVVDRLEHASLDLSYHTTSHILQSSSLTAKSLYWFSKPIPALEHVIIPTESIRLSPQIQTPTRKATQINRLPYSFLGQIES